MTFREYTGKNVEEAIRAAMRDFNADLSDLDIEILSSGSRGILGVGGEEARILAAPKSAVASAESVREPAAAPAPARDDAAGPGIGADVAPDEEDPAGDQAEALARAEARRAAEGGRGGRGGDRGRGRAGAGFGGVATREARAGAERGPRPPRRDYDRAPRERRAADGRARREPREAREPREPREPAVFIPALPLEELAEADRAALEQGRSVLQDLVRLMGIDATVEIGAGAETAKLNVSGTDLGVLIGRRGDTLAALQHLVNLIVAKRQGEWRRISVDVENYRGRREQQLRDVAERAARRVEETGKIIQLDPMPALERRIVHVALIENPRVRTQSVGVEPNRRIVILPAEQASS